jgi:hypothetical protein
MTIKATVAAGLRTSLEELTTPIDFADLEVRRILKKTRDGGNC